MIDLWLNCLDFYVIACQSQLKARTMKRASKWMWGIAPPVVTPCDALLSISDTWRSRSKKKWGNNRWSVNLAVKDESFMHNCTTLSKCLGLSQRKCLQETGGWNDETCRLAFISVVGCECSPQATCVTRTKNCFARWLDDSLLDVENMAESSPSIPGRSQEFRPSTPVQLASPLDY